VTSRPFFVLSFLLLSPLSVCSQTIRVGVLGFFHPQELTLAAGPASPVQVSVGDEHFLLERGVPGETVRIRADGNSELLVESKDHALRARELRAAARNGGSATLVLAVPGKIARSYRGILAIKNIGGALVPVLTMDLETAVASAVLAESAPGTPLEALKAQAVVARSYYVAGAGRHENYDFCDLTHCQALREPPAADSAAARASAETRELVLSYDEKPIATMFTRSCGGRTRTPAEVGLPSGAYPYFAVVCDICYNHPVRWSLRVSAEDAALAAKGEAGRLSVARRLGWNAVPSNNFTAHPEHGQILLSGIGQGHGIGLCQRGAADMARHGASFRDILTHYFPNTKLSSVPVHPE